MAKKKATSTPAPATVRGVPTMPPKPPSKPATTPKTTAQIRQAEERGRAESRAKAKKGAAPKGVSEKTKITTGPTDSKNKKKKKKEDKVTSEEVVVEEEVVEEEEDTGGSADALLDYLKQQEELDAQREAEKAKAERQSAYDLLLQEFGKYGLGSLVEPLKGFIQDGSSPAELTIRLRESKAYQNRFAANKQRIGKGLGALSEAEYINLEDQYQNIMRQYGLPESYYSQTIDPETGIKTQKGFEQLIAGDVSATELEDRIQTAQNRVLNAAPEIASALKNYYPEITNGDILGYALNPEKAITDIKRKVTAAEIGAGAAMAGLSATQARAEELGRYGVTGEQAREGFKAVAEVAPRGEQLSQFYQQSPYTQATAEQEVFGLTGATEAAKKRKQLSQLEIAAFSGESGIASGALARDRAGAY